MEDVMIVWCLSGLSTTSGTFPLYRTLGQCNQEQSDVSQIYCCQHPNSYWSRAAERG